MCLSVTLREEARLNLRWGLRLRRGWLLPAPRGPLSRRACREGCGASAASPGSAPRLEPRVPPAGHRGAPGGARRVDTCAPQSARAVGAGRVTASPGRAGRGALRVPQRETASGRRRAAGVPPGVHVPTSRRGSSPRGFGPGWSPRGHSERPPPRTLRCVCWGRVRGGVSAGRTRCAGSELVPSLTHSRGKRLFAKAPPPVEMRWRGRGGPFPPPPPPHFHYTIRVHPPSPAL